VKGWAVHTLRAICIVAAVMLVGGCGGSRAVVSNGPVTVDGRKLVVHCSGTGSPTIVLDAGLGDSSSRWAGIQPRIARIGRVCAYDRLGEGESDAPAGPQTVADQAETLDRLVEAAGWQGPFVLVGHSWGGAIDQVVARDHLDEVAGMVLIDSSVADQLRKWLELIPPKPKTGVDPYGQIRTDLTGTLGSKELPEGLSWAGSDPELRRLATLGETPLVVLTAGMLGLQFPTASLQRRAYAIWLELHHRLAALSSNAVEAIAENSGHYIYESQPDLVVAAIRAVMQAAREHAPLASCQAVFRGHAGVECR
jgi:pimeloyl-ACP methyl ester carboxylesterase